MFGEFLPGLVRVMPRGMPLFLSKLYNFYLKYLEQNNDLTVPWDYKIEQETNEEPTLNLTLNKLVMTSLNSSRSSVPLPSESASCQPTNTALELFNSPSFNFWSSLKMGRYMYQTAPHVIND